MIVRFVSSYEAYTRLKLIFVDMIKWVWYFEGEGMYLAYKLYLLSGEHSYEKQQQLNRLSRKQS